MNSNIIFTDEAKQEMNNYLKEIRISLTETDLTDTEIEESLSEIKDHILSYCEIKSKGSVISTDLVNSATKKLGDPSTIARTLQNELDFSDNFDFSLEEADGYNTANNLRDNTSNSYLEVKAVHLVNLYKIIGWLLTAFAFNIAFSGIIGDVSFYNYFAVLYLIIIGFLVIIKNTDHYEYNDYLRNNIDQNFHINIVPVITTLLVLFHLYMANYIYSGITSLAIVSFLWFLNFINLGGKEYFEELGISIIDS